MFTRLGVLLIASLASFLLVAAPGHAQIVVDIVNGNSNVAFDSITQKYDVTLTATGANSAFFVYAVPQNGVVPQIRDVIVHTNGHSTSLFLGEDIAGSSLPPASLDTLDFTGPG